VATSADGEEIEVAVIAGDVAAHCLLAVKGPGASQRVGTMCAREKEKNETHHQLADGNVAAGGF
jgi:hypothetical protein